MTPEERAELRRALMERYKESQDTSGIDAAQADSERRNMIAGIAQGLQTVAGAGGVAAGGAPLDNSAFDAQRQSAKAALESAYKMQQGRQGQALADIQMQQGFDKEAVDAENRAIDRATRATEFEATQGLNERKLRADEERRKEEAARTARQNAETNRFRERELDLQGQKIASEVERKEAKGSIIDQTIDKNYAENFAKYLDTGRKEAVENLERLKAAEAKILGKDSAGNAVKKAEGSLFGLVPSSGRINDILPDLLKSDDSLTLQQDVQGSAAGAMRAALGPAFTQKEGERVQADAYDPKLSPEENAKKIRRSIEKVEGTIKNADAQAEYHQKHGTMRGFNPAAVGEKSTEPAPTGGISPAAAAAARKWVEENPNDPKAAAVLEKLKSKGL